MSALFVYMCVTLFYSRICIHYFTCHIFYFLFLYILTFFWQECFPFYTGTLSILPAFYNLLKGPYNSCKVPFCCLVFYQMCPINQNCRLVRYRFVNIDFCDKNRKISIDSFTINHSKCTCSPRHRRYLKIHCFFLNKNSMLRILIRNISFRRCQGVRVHGASSRTTIRLSPSFV